MLCEATFKIVSNQGFSKIYFNIAEENIFYIHTLSQFPSQKGNEGLTQLILKHINVLTLQILPLP